MLDHTPGPWEVIIVGEGIETTACGPVKTTYRSQSSPNTKLMRDEAMANARLIAAAPDLLESLMFFTSIYNLKTVAGADYYTSAEKARAAIRKAVYGDPPAQDSAEPRAEG